MEASYDPEARATYVYISYRKVARTLSLSDSVNVDVDDDGGVVGVEVLDHG